MWPSALRVELIEIEHVKLFVKVYVCLTETEKKR